MADDPDREHDDNVWLTLSIAERRHRVLRLTALAFVTCITATIPMAILSGDALTLVAGVLPAIAIAYALLGFVKDPITGDIKHRLIEIASVLFGLIILSGRALSVWASLE